MPFDGTDPRAAAAIAMIDALLAYFDGGNKWLGTGEFHDAHGRRCLVSAMAHVRQRDKTAGDPTSRYIRLAVRGTPQVIQRTIGGINDSCWDYRELADILRRARAVAAGGPPGPTRRETRKRLAEIAAQRQKTLQRLWAERHAPWPMSSSSCAGRRAEAETAEIPG